ncbi:hypothetical protein MKEN_01402600 [Mycena kentingensis (nom. inval.)]|nr:hypothetical protein MKEN_01402600 [Mycena kentingensis (nom. inval.)]
MAAIRAADSHCRVSLTAAPAFSETSCAAADVLLAPQLTLAISGVLNSSLVPPTDILASQLAQHLVNYLQANATELGIAVSSLYLDADNLPKLRITSTRCSSDGPHLQRAHVLLTSIKLKYAWTTADPTNTRIHPFAATLALPFRILLDNVVQRFVTWQLVRRYPLIFGSWAQQLDVERPYFKKLFRSVSRIATRSPNDVFRRKCTRMLETMKEQHETDFAATSADEAPLLDDEQALCLSMELCYRNHLRRPLFKGSSRTVPTRGDSDNELSQEAVTTQQQFDEGYLWDPPPEEPKPVEYQDPFDFWHDSDAEDDIVEVLSVSSDEMQSCPNEDDLDVNMDNPKGSADATRASTVIFADAAAVFAGLSNKQCQEGDEELELAFDSGEEAEREGWLDLNFGVDMEHHGITGTDGDDEMGFAEEDWA